MNTLALLLTALLVSVPAFLAVYLIANRIRNFGIVDVAWAGGFLPLVLFYALAGLGTPETRAILASMVCLWSLRLTLQLGLRVLRLHPEEDGRYARLREEWADALSLKMPLFFLFQGVLLVVLSLPFALVAGQAGGGPGPWTWCALVLWVLALAGETVADLQLASFKRNPANRGRVCDMGLWGWSRHPNYFFEFLIWVSYALVAMPSLLAWLSPALMLYFLTRVTGVRYTEEQLLRSKGEAYRTYQQRTSAFFPWPPRGRNKSSTPIHHDGRPA